MDTTEWCLVNIPVYMHPEGNVVDIADQEYIKPCGEQVTWSGPYSLDSFCILAANHLGTDHENMAGRRLADPKMTAERWIERWGKNDSYPNMYIEDTSDYEQDLKEYKPHNIFTILLVIFPLYVIMGLLIARAV